jgi:hypothetical protein
MGAPKVVDTSKSQAKVERAKLEVQKSADAFEEQLQVKQNALSKQGLEAFGKVQEMENEIGQLGVNEVQATTGFLSGLTGKLSGVDDRTNASVDGMLANTDKLFSVKPHKANFLDIASIFS